MTDVILIKQLHPLQCDSTFFREKEREREGPYVMFMSDNDQADIIEAFNSSF